MSAHGSRPSGQRSRSTSGVCVWCAPPRQRPPPSHRCTLPPLPPTHLIGQVSKVGSEEPEIVFCAPWPRLQRDGRKGLRPDARRFSKRKVAGRFYTPAPPRPTPPTHPSVAQAYLVRHTVEARAGGPATALLSSRGKKRHSMRSFPLGLPRVPSLPLFTPALSSYTGPPRLSTTPT